MIKNRIAKIIKNGDYTCVGGNAGMDIIKQTPGGAKFFATNTSAEIKLLKQRLISEIEHNPALEYCSAGM